MKSKWIEIEKKERGGANIEVGTKKILIMTKTSVGIPEIFAKKYFKDKNLSYARVFIGPLNKDKNAFKIGIMPWKSEDGSNALSISTLRKSEYKQKVHYMSGPAIYRQIEEIHGITKGKIQGHHKMKWKGDDGMLISRIEVKDEDVFEKQRIEKEKKIKKSLEESEEEFENDDDEFEEEE